MLLDTCAAIWLMNGDPISADGRNAIRAAQTASLGLYVSPMTAWEIATLAAKSRLQLSLSPESWFNALLTQAEVRLAPMTPKILIDSASLPGLPPKDPVDRIIVATGRAFGWTVITRDRELIGYALAGHLNVVEC